MSKWVLWVFWDHILAPVTRNWFGEQFLKQWHRRYHRNGAKLPRYDPFMGGINMRSVGFSIFETHNTPQSRRYAET